MTDLPDQQKLFAETFRDLRTLRRIPMRLFQEKVRTSTSYIHDIEQNDVLPSRERAVELAAVFTADALEQGLADPERDARELLRARERTLFKRLEIPPVLTELLIAVREAGGEADIDPEFLDLAATLATLDDDQRQDLRQPLEDAISLFRMLPPEHRSGLGRTIEDTYRTIRDVSKEERPVAIMTLVEALDEALAAVRARHVGKGEPPAAVQPQPRPWADRARELGASARSPATERD